MCRNLYLIQIPTHALLIYMCFTILFKILNLKAFTPPYDPVEIQVRITIQYPLLVAQRYLYIGRFKTRITCSRRCYTIKCPLAQKPYVPIMSLYFKTLHRMDMNAKFSSWSLNNRRTDKQAFDFIIPKSK